MGYEDDCWRRACKSEEKLLASPNFTTESGDKCPSMAMTAAVRFLSSKQGSSGLGFIQLQLRVKPGACKTRQGILAVTSNAVELCVAAQPRQGEANLAVLRVLSNALGICPSRLRIVRGSKSREKIAAFDCRLADGPGPAYAEVIINLLREASHATPSP
ncbi:hypothetical protein E4U57_004899 [Claviceps arundinis]|uniref:Uncharacterized protein n=1 Tax=Claviceps arundinis TaxID=1623583 RepID=A0ABQ7P459_9HYPO|nr:hypothetical protein E4U57_004899 [Claviceps arundinis]